MIIVKRRVVNASYKDTAAGIPTLWKLEYLAFADFQCATDVFVERSLGHSSEVVIGIDVLLDRLTTRGPSQHESK